MTGLPQSKGVDEVLILVKALPQPGKGHGELVCCAGVTLDGQWYRQFPIRFRKLQDKKFSRWQWIRYSWSRPKADARPESRRVHEESIEVIGEMPSRDKAIFIDRITVRSHLEAEEKGLTLALIRPAQTHFYWNTKSEQQMSAERQAFQNAAAQISLFDMPEDKELSALEPCPYEFRMSFVTELGTTHDMKCGDWETNAMYYNFGKSNSDEETVLRRMSEVFNEEYPSKGMALALGTHSVFGTWLLVGIIRVDQIENFSFGF